MMPRRQEVLLRRSLLAACVAASASCLLAPSSQAAGFCTQYAQTQSNAGQCDDCRLKIAVDSRSQSYAVEASNGWTAHLAFLNGDRSHAGGSGVWKSGVGHAYAGQTFLLVLSQERDALAMVMTTYVAGEKQVIRARFRCLDGDL